MTKKQRMISEMLGDGRSYRDICKKLTLSMANLYSTIYQMKKKGLIVPKPKKPLRSITTQQKAILLFYSYKRPVPEIAKLMGLTCQTVMNHATEGFKRLGLTQKGVDRIALLPEALGDKQPVTMEDPAFN